MKNKFLAVPIMALMMFSLLFFGVGCEKVRRCDDYEYGRFCKLSEPHEHPYVDYKIQAVFLSNGEVKGITGHIPAQFRESDTVFVKISLKEVYPKGKLTNTAADNMSVYKIMCIEEEPS